MIVDSDPRAAALKWAVLLAPWVKTNQSLCRNEAFKSPGRLKGQLFHIGTAQWRNKHVCYQDSYLSDVPDRDRVPEKK